ncbi:McbB family protein [Lactococcus lactis]|uniref:McbB family protein n=1 Tax=Lactococcus lactis TaxID=1358 RepID=UPI0022DEA1F4|nr:McbB family protein [Lactococcus lactis]
MKKYRVCSYLIYDLSDKETVVQTDNSLSVITDKNMSIFLKRIENNDYISEQELHEEFSERFTSAKKYLLDKQIISEYSSLNFSVENIYFIYNGNMNLQYLPRKIGKIKVNIYSYESIGLEAIKENSLIILLLNKYQPSYVDHIIESSSPKNWYIFTIFSYGFRYYMDNIYSLIWEVPKHRDHLGIIQTEISDTEDRISYKKLVDYIIDKDIKFNIEQPMDELDWLFLSNLIFIRVSEIFLMSNQTYVSDSELLKVFKIDIKNKKISEDSASYWELTQ